MTDRELLELAAKAAGMELMDRPEVHCYVGGLMTTTGHWSPLTDDGDALRLAVKLNLIIGSYGSYTSVGETFDKPQITTKAQEVLCWHHETNGDPYAATRRAIVRAAAEIGRGML